jgi:2'-5' RNA ligase
LYGLYFFPDKRFPRVLATFVHGEKGHRETSELAKQIDFHLGPLKIPREERAFRGHLTLARLDPRAKHDALEAALTDMMRRDFGDFPVREFHLYRSELRRGGAVYTRLAAFALEERRA